MEALGTIAAAMTKGGFRPHLLYGVTGSGKTTVYFAAMQRALEAGKSALLLVPEIGLTPAMVGTDGSSVRRRGSRCCTLSSLPTNVRSSGTGFVVATLGSWSARDQRSLRPW